MSTAIKPTEIVQKFSLPSRVPTRAKMFLKILQKMSVGHLRLQTPEQMVLNFGDVSQPAAELFIHDWRACAKIMSAADIGFAESYAQGWLDTPDLTAVLRVASQNEAVLTRFFSGNVMKLWYRLKHILRPNTRKGSQKNIHAHYDIGNNFYELWLDKTWTYSSAIFAGDFTKSLEQAQSDKYQRIIDQLGLKAGDRVLEIGCGWGGFAAHAAQAGIYVDGVTISQAQFDCAQVRIKSLQLSEWVRLEMCDYRDVTGQYDAVVSIEMFEAVGEAYWGEYFAVVNRLLKPKAKALIQTITILESRFEQYRSSTDFIQQYIIPGGMLPSPERFEQLAIQNGFHSLNGYAFGQDYAETLRRWRSAFLAQIEAVQKLGFDERFIRIWQMYYAYCETGFDEGRTDVIQFLLQKQQ